MKLTKGQLRRIILNEMAMIKPGGSMSPDHYDKVTSMIGTGDESNIRQADQLA